jgi:hypothetical protein
VLLVATQSMSPISPAISHDQVTETLFVMGVFRPSIHISLDFKANGIGDAASRDNRYNYGTFAFLKTDRCRER